MKKLYITLVFIFSLQFGYSQSTYKITYLATSQSDSTDVASKMQGIAYLYMNSQSSIYTEAKTMQLDSVFNELQEGRLSEGHLLANMHSLPKPKDAARIVKDYKEERITNHNKVGTNAYVYSEAMQIGEWKLLDEEKKIHNFQCQLAEIEYGGRVWQAYYTTAIPLSDGPYKFSGLPGLIVLLQDKEEHYSFEMLRLDPIEEIPSYLENPRENTSSISKQEYYNEYRKFTGNPLIQLEQMGVVLDENNRRTAQQNIRNKNAKNNNPIELSN